MKGKRILLKGAIFCIFTTHTIVFSTLSFGATFCVNNASELQSALTTAVSNGENDTIKIVQGTYSGNFIYASDESNSLTLKGGYTEGCASQTVDPANTILDGGGLDMVLALGNNGTANFSLESLTFQNGSVTSSSTVKDGGGLYAKTDGHITLTNNAFNNNTSSSKGGGAYLFGEDITLTRNTFSDNTFGNGGGVYVDSTGTVTLSQNVFTDNISIYYTGGGGAYLSGTNVTLNNNTFTGNTITGGRGGGAFISSSKITLTDNTFTANKATDMKRNGYGGGVFIRNKTNSQRADDVTLTNNVFTMNEAWVWGGGASITGDTVSLSGNIFSGNKANLDMSDGGGLYLNVITLTLTDNTFSGNEAGSGGGIQIIHGANTILSNNTFLENKAEYGAGVLIGGSSHDVTLTNNLFIGNAASYGGSWISGREITLSNNTFYDNTATNWGGGLCLTIGFSGSLYNNIIGTIQLPEDLTFISIT